jgi:hypothetical protein
MYLCLALLALTPIAFAEPEAPPSETTLARWVQQLGDDQFTRRESATESLVKAGPRALPALREGLHKGDAETRERIRGIFPEIEKRSQAALEALGVSVQRQSDGITRVVACPRDKPTRLRDDDLIHLDAFPGLENVFLDNAKVTDAGLKLVGRVERIKRLYLSGTTITDDGLAHLKGMQNLESLTLDDTPITGSGLAHLKTLTNLSELSLLRTKLTADGFAAGIAGLKELKHLRDLCLMETNLTDAWLAPLAELPAVEILSLGDTRVSNAGLAQVAKMPALRWLDLRRTRIGDAGILHLLAAKQLEGLNLFGTQVTAKGLAHIGKLPQCKRLLLSRGNLTDRQQRELERLLPGMRIDWSGP